MRIYLRLLLSALSVGTPADAYARAQKEAANLPPDDRSLDAEAARGAALSHRDWLIADAMRRRLREQWRELFRDVDVVLCPSMPTVAFPHDHSPFAMRRIEIDGKNYSYRYAGLAWAEPATTTGLPATVMPMDRSDDGLPIGMQIIGPFLEDRTPLTFAVLVEQKFGGFVPPPGYA